MSMRIQLRDLAPGQDYALQFRSNNGNGTVSEWSQIQRFTATNDTIRPGNVLNLTFVTSGSTFIGRWDKTTVDENGAVLRDFRQYRVNISDGVTNKDFFTVGERFDLTKEMNETAFGSFKTDLTIKVWAVDMTYNESGTVAQTTLSASTPPTPSTPVVSAYLGTLLVTWDGKANDTTAMPVNLLYCEVHVSTTTSFTPTAATFVGRVYADGSANTQPITGLTYGTTYFIRLVAINSFQKKSSPSAQASGVPARISGLDIQNGQISTAQINFTAFDIGGANAYYPATNVARDALTGVKNGDIAYVTGTGYTTYRYNGSSWIAAPEIGVVQGSKIIAGTITSAAVGTNLLIANTANIANGIIDNAKISDLSAAKITAGTLSAAITLSGRIATALTGQRVEINSSGIFRYDSAGVQTVAIDSAGALLTGEYRSAASGRRITMGASGASGAIKFFAPDGTTAELQSLTASNGDEISRWGIDISSATWEYWNGLSVSSRESIAGYSQVVLFGFATDETKTPPEGQGIFQITALSDRTSTTKSNPRFTITKDTVSSTFQSAGGFLVNEQTNTITTSPYTIKPKLQITSTGVHNYLIAGERFDVYESATVGGTLTARFQITDTDIWFDYPDTPYGGARLLIRPSSGSAFGLSPIIQLVGYYNFGIEMWYAGASDGSGGRLDIRDATGAVYQPIWASDFVFSSSETQKGDITAYNEDAKESIRGLTPKKFRRKKGRIDPGKRQGPLTAAEADPGLEDREQIGFIAEEVPEQFRVEGSDLGPGLDVIAILAANVQVTQEVLDRLDAIEERINKNNGGTK